MFVRDFHKGVAALVNSLCAHDFRGIVWAGYEGDLPPWSRPLQVTPNYAERQISCHCSIRFVRLSTPKHFTHYKPEFMLQVLDQLDPDSTGICYFDPDIVIKCRWTFFEEWISNGVALCEDVNS